MEYLATGMTTMVNGRSMEELATEWENYSLLLSLIILVSGFVMTNRTNLSRASSSLT